MKKGELVYGFGINDADYAVYRTAKVDGKRKIIWFCPVYKVWNNMLRRAYDISYKTKYPTYEGVFVNSEWKSFTAFKSWWDKQEHTETLSLDKDIKFSGNKEYSAENCFLIPDQINGLFTDHGRARGELPLGVTRRVLTGKYMAQIQLGLGRGHKNLGSYDTPQEAHKAWQLAKAQVVKDVIGWYENQPYYNADVVDSLNTRIDLLLSYAQEQKETIKL